MKMRMAIAVLLTATMGLAGVGCTPPSSEWQAEQQVHNFWNAIGLLLVLGLCQNTSTCPIPGEPVGVPAPIAAP